MNNDPAFLAFLADYNPGFLVLYLMYTWFDYIVDLSIIKVLEWKN